MPRAYSGHNAFGDWGPPSDRAGPVVVVGLDPARLEAAFVGCRLRARVSNRQGIDNDENGAPIELCAGTRRPWSRIWGDLAHLG